MYKCAKEKNESQKEKEKEKERDPHLSLNYIPVIDVINFENQ